MLISPKYAVIKAVEIIKCNTSKALKQKFTLLSKFYWDDKGIWVILAPQLESMRR